MTPRPPTSASTSPSRAGRGDHRLRRRRRHRRLRADHAAAIRCVVLEAGPYLTAEDYENDEWAAFNQMAWLDMRTTSGSWRVAQDFPNLPAWIVKAVGGSTTHWSGATPRFMAHEFKARTTYGDVDGANLLDWPITLDDLAPYYDKAEIAIGSTHRHGRAAAAGQQQLQGVRQRRRAGRLPATTPPARTAPTPSRTTAARPRSRTASTSRATRTRSKWSTAVREIPRALETGKLRPAARAPGRPDHPRRRRARSTGSSTSTRTATCTGRPPGWSAWPATRSSRRGCC